MDLYLNELPEQEPDLLAQHDDEANDAAAGQEQMSIPLSDAPLNDLISESSVQGLLTENLEPNQNNTMINVNINNQMNEVPEQNLIPAQEGLVMGLLVQPMQGNAEDLLQAIDNPVMGNADPPRLISICRLAS
jgi:hypothetical protein